MSVDNSFLSTFDNFTVHIGKKGAKSRINRNIVSFTLPGLSSNEILIPHRNIPLYVPSEVTTTDSLEIRFLCDEKMDAYEEVYNWIYDNAGINPDIGNTMDLKDYDDVIIDIKSSHHNVVKQLVFTNAFPTSVSALEFNTQGEGDVVYASFSVTLRFDDFCFVKPVDKSICETDDSP